MKKIILLLLALLLISSLALAHGEEGFTTAEELIKQQVPCTDLTDEQLELIGDYYMEQMHPGEWHGIMDERMGGEGSLTLKQAHLQIADAFYCGEHTRLNAGMMNMMMGRSNHGFGYMMQGRSFFLSGFIWLLLLILVLWIIFSQKNKRGMKTMAKKERDTLAAAGAGAIIAALVMLILGIGWNVGFYRGAAQQMAMWHMFFSPSAGGIIAGMIEAAVITFLLIYAFIWTYKKLR